MDTFKKLRKEKGLTQVELAEILQIDQTTVSKWELGKAIPDTPLLIRLADFFDVSTDYLLGLSSLYYPDRIKSADTLSTDEKELLEIFRSLSHGHGLQVLEYARYFADREYNAKTKK